MEIVNLHKTTMRPSLDNLLSAGLVKSTKSLCNITKHTDKLSKYLLLLRIQTKNTVNDWMFPVKGISSFDIQLDKQFLKKELD